MNLQLDRYLHLRAIDTPVEAASEQSGIGREEAALWEEDIASGAVELPRVCARAGAREGEQAEEASMEDVKTSIRVGDGPEVEWHGDKSLDDPANAEAKEEMTKFVEGALDRDAHNFDRASTVAGEKLQRFIERAERLDEEIKGLNEDKSDLFKEMKSDGFDTKTVKRILKLRKMEPHNRREAQALLSTYMDAIGMTPIEEAIALAAAA
jgi:uncharacterized protein (UPF0335 family)